MKRKVIDTQKIRCSTVTSPGITQYVREVLVIIFANGTTDVLCQQLEKDGQCKCDNSAPCPYLKK
jgi:hypothetical protein